MTVLDHRSGALDPAPDRWTYDQAPHAGVGVHVDDEQVELLDPDTMISDVVVPWALPDPLANYAGLAHSSEMPNLLWRTPEGRHGHVVVPAIGRVDWSLDGYGDWRAFQHDGWWRFPSVPVRLVIPDAYDETEEVARCVRVWNVWPLRDEEMQVAVMDESERLFDTGWYADARTFARVHLELDRPCQLVSDVPIERHLHEEDGRCPVGQLEADIMRHSLFLDGAVGWWRRPDLSPVFTDGATGHLWNQLVASSQRNSAACLGIVPAVDEPVLALSESRFSPWVLS